MKQILNSLKDTEKFAQELAKDLKGGEIIFLEGDLGSGKTYFTKMLGRALFIKDSIKSPTFVFYRRYKGNFLDIYHFDLYRFLDTDVDISSIGILDAMEDKKGIIVVEWANLLNKNDFQKFMTIKFKTLDENKREVEVIR